MFYLEHFGLTDAGKVRENNEDSLLVATGEDETHFAVADGIGGFEAGEVASRMAIDALKKMEPNDPFDGSVKEANRRIRAASQGDESLSGMGTTVVAIRFGGTKQKPRAEIAHVGDSRAYLLRGGELKPVTEDHSLVSELVKSGDLTRAEAADHPQRNLITRALGAEENVDADTAVLPVEANDRFLLCSDGLSDMVKEARIEEVLKEHAKDPDTAAKQLLSDALDAGGSDNITIIVIDVRDRDEKEPSRSQGTREMRAVGRPATGASGATGAAAPSAFASTRNMKGSSGRGRKAGKKKGLRAGIVGIFGRLVRGLAVLAVLALAITPVYLWGSSRYFLDSDGGEVVAYRGLPYTVGDMPFNEEWRRTGIALEDVGQTYRDPINDNTYYEQEGIEQVLDQMETDAAQNEGEEAEQENQNGGGNSPEGRGN